MPGGGSQGEPMNRWVIALCLVVLVVVLWCVIGWFVV